MLQRCDVIVGEEFGEPIAPLHRQDRRQRVELEGPPGFGSETSAREVMSSIGAAPSKAVAWSEHSWPDPARLAPTRRRSCQRHPVIYRSVSLRRAPRPP
jgi:hypothetical protein